MRLRRKASLVAILICVIGFVSSAVIADRTLERFPNSADEFAYLFQAETFALGRLWNPAHDLQEAFDFAHIVARDGKWVSRFPPGWPLILAAADRLHVPYWLVNPLLGALLLAAIHLLARERYDQRIALITTASVGSSAFFLLNAGSFFSHVPCALFSILFYWQGMRLLRCQRTVDAILAGVWIGCVFLVRPYNAALIGLPFGVYVLGTRSWGRWTHWLWLGAGALPALLFNLYYNQSITGDPLLPVTVWVEPGEGLGFGHKHTPAAAVRHTVIWFRSLAKWTSIAMVVLLIPAWLLAIRRRRGAATLYGAVFLITVLGYTLYWSLGGNQYGPRFYFEAYPFAVLCVVAVVFGDAWPSRWSVAARALYVAGIVGGLALLPGIVSKEHQVVHERQDLYRLVEAAGIGNAIVLVRSTTGVERDMPVEDLTRNRPDLQQSVLYVHDLGAGFEQRLRTAFPDRSFYVYERDADEVEGTLKPAR